MTPPTRATTAGRAYLDLRNKARQDRRPVDELMQLYVLESFLARMSLTEAADRFVLKGGLLLAVFGERRPTRDIDLQAQAIGSDPGTVRAAISDIAAASLNDGVIFDTQTATARVIREEPPPQIVHLPRVLGGTIAVSGYPLAMVHAEKIVTAVARGTASTRWRDFADMYALARHHPIDGTELSTSIREVARHRGTPLAPLSNVLDGYGAIGQQHWEAWRRKQRLDDRLPSQFSDVVMAVVAFADPAIIGMPGGQSWDPATAKWS
jgi:hypothetical protein